MHWHTQTFTAIVTQLDTWQVSQGRDEESVFPFEAASHKSEKTDLEHQLHTEPKRPLGSTPHRAQRPLGSDQNHHLYRWTFFHFSSICTDGRFPTFSSICTDGCFSRLEKKNGHRVDALWNESGAGLTARFPPFFWNKVHQNLLPKV